MGFALIIMLLGNALNPNPLLGAASRLQTYVSIASINCLSIEPHKVVFDRNEYWNPKLPEEIVDRLGIKTVLLNADYAACPWSFFATVVPGTVSAVRYNDQAAQYLVSIGICQRNVDGSINPNKCLTKNKRWSTARLRREIIGLRGKKSQGGLPLAKPKSLADGLDQLVVETVRCPWQ